jgi:hypothetical protein
MPTCQKSENQNSLKPGISEENNNQNTLTEHKDRSLKNSISHQHMANIEKTDFAQTGNIRCE